jgi:hypothetical protein
LRFRDKNLRNKAEIKIAGSPQSYPPAANYVGCETRRRTCSKDETETEELCEIKWDYQIVGTTA